MVRRPDVLIITGMSGAGRSTVAKVLEDLGYFVIDNLPPRLIPEAVKANDVELGDVKLAVVVDVRGGRLSHDFESPLMDVLGLQLDASVLFLDASDDSLVKRYGENRRPHPLGLETIAESIAAERALLTAVRATADVVIDTSDYNVHELKRRIEEEFSERTSDRPVRVSVRSFGFKHGTPRDVDLMFDVRFLPNPHWVTELRLLTGLDEQVRSYVMDNDDTREFLRQLKDMLTFLLPRYLNEGKSYLSIGVGCTGGHHRSVAIAEELGLWLADQHVDVAVRHRDKDR